MAHFTEDAVFDYVPMQQPLTGHTPFGEFLTGLFHAFPDYATTAETAWVSGNIVVTEHTIQGSFENDWIDIPATGTPGSPHKHLDVWEYEGNKVARLTSYDNTQSLMSSWGLMPPLEPPPLKPSFELPEPSGSGLGPVETVLEALELESSGDLEGLARRMRADLQIWRAPFGDLMDRANDIGIRELMLQGMPDLHAEIQRIIDLGEGWVLAEVRLRGTHTRPYLGISPIGGSVEIPAAYLYLIDEAGLIANHRIHADHLALLTQIGAFPPMPTEGLLAAYTTISEGVNARDPEAYVTNAGDYYTFRYGPIPDPMNVDETRAAFEHMFTAFPDFHTDTGLVLAGNNLVVVEHTFSGTHQADFDLGAFGFLPPTGKEMHTPHIDVLEFVGGKLARAVSYLDFQSQLIQLSVMPTPAMPQFAPSFTLPGPEPGERTPMEASELAIATWNDHDLAGQARLLHTESDLFDNVVGQPLSREAYIALREMYFTSFPDARMTPWKRVDLGNGWVVLECVWTGSLQAPFMGIPATGRSFMLPGVVLQRFNEEGLQTYMHAYYDNITLLAQLGAFDPVILTARGAPEGMALSWPLVTSQGMVLESTEALSPALWSTVDDEPVVDGDRYRVVVEASGSGRYFRLRQPTD